MRPKLLRDKFPNGSRQFLCVSRNEQADVHVGRFAERLELRGKRLNFLNALAGDLQSGVNENVRHIVVCSADAADKAYKCVQTLNAVSVGVNKTCLVGNIVSKLKALFDNNNVAVGVLNRFVCKLDELLGFAGAFLPIKRVIIVKSSCVFFPQCGFTPFYLESLASSASFSPS